MTTAIALVAGGLVVAGPAVAEDDALVPVLASDSLEGPAPTFAWGAVTGAVGYSLTVATGTDASSTVLASVRTTNTRWVPTGELGTTDLGRTVYWRVAPYFSTSDASIGEWSTWGTYDQPGTRVPAPQSPTDGAQVAYPEPVVFSWSPVAGAMSYDVQYTAEPSGWTGATTITAKGGTTASPATLLARTATDSSTGTAEPLQWRWRVRANLFSASAAAVAGPWSDSEQRFTVTWPSTSAPVLVAPADIDPADPMPQVVSDPEFTWQPVAGASAYRIQFGKDRSSDRKQLMNVLPTMTTTVASTVYVPATPLLDQQYFWQVTPLDANGVAGPASDVWMFEKQWTAQPGPTNDDYPGTVYPEPITGALTKAEAEPIPLDKLVLRWNPVARATYYRVEVVPLDGRARLTCNTASTSATVIAKYTGSTSASALAQQSAGGCLWATNAAARITPGYYRWNVRAYDLAAGTSTLIGAEDASSIVSDISDPESQAFPLRVRYIRVVEPTAGGSDYGIGPGSTVVGSPGEPSPLLEWNAIDGATLYEVEVGLNSTITTNRVGTFFTTGTTLRATGVFANNQVGKPYYWRVKAAQGTTSDYTYIGDASITASWSRANIPTGGIRAEASTVDPSTVVLRWTPQIDTAPNDGGSRGYAVTIRNAGVIVGAENAAVEYPFYVLRNPSTKKRLPAGTYQVTVAPLDAAGTAGNASDPVSVTLPALTASDLRTSTTGGAVTFSWDGSARAKAYKVSYRIADSTDAPKTVLTTGVTTVTVPDVVIGEYEWWVTATDYDGIAEDSARARFTRAARPVPLLTAEDATLSTNGTLTSEPLQLAWSAVPGASRYVVRIAPSTSAISTGTKFETSATRLAPTGTSATAALKFGTEYQWQVTAVAESSSTVLGTSEIRHLTVTTPPGKVAKPRAVATGTQVAVTWTAPTAAFAGSAEPLSYDLRYRVTDPTGAGFAWTVVPGLASTAHTLTELARSTTYDFAVRAVNTEGASPWSDAATATTATAPGVVQSLTATPRLGGLDLTWSAPASNGGASVTGYVVMVRVAGGSWLTTTTSATRIGITGLDRQKSYEIGVAAVNAVGAGAVATMSAATLGLPSAPRSLKAVRGDRTATVTWTAPSSTGGSAITGYSVEYRVKSSSTGAWGAWTVRSVSATTVKLALTSLSNGRTYQVRVAGRTALGLGSYAAAVTFVPAGKPSAPTSVKAVASTGKITVTWVKSVANGSTISGYQVQYSLNGSTWTTLPTVSATTTSKSFTGTRKGKTYWLRVTALSNLGSSPASASVKVVAK